MRCRSTLTLTDNIKTRPAMTSSQAATGVLLAKNYLPGKSPNPKGWWMSEKLDGVRAYAKHRERFPQRRSGAYLVFWFLSPHHAHAPRRGARVRRSTKDRGVTAAYPNRANVPLLGIGRARTFTRGEPPPLSIFLSPPPI